MTGTILSHNKRLVFSLLILFGFSSTVLSFQKNLTGNINQPKSHVVSIPNAYPVSDRVIVDDATGFSVNDTILIIQMQGVKILTAPLGSYGTLQDIFGEPGMHEFLIITAVNANEIVFSSYLLKDYDPNGNIQIVRVPYYNSATVTGTLFCDPWNPTTGSGGVLAMIIGRTLKLNADINVSGKGFIGGIDAIGGGICWNTDPPTYGKEYYDQSSLHAGFKGEGLAIHNDAGTLLNPLYMKGMGPNFTGGGGGNGRYSGGGGGSNRGEGGQGGSEDCSPPWVGGKGGFIADHASLVNRIYMGGGGGASTSLTGTSLPGGNGGGIVIIVADTIIGNGGNILSNGGNGGSATGVAGSGGGGASGSIALSLNSYGLTPLNFSLSGGKGGNNPGTFGEGGGGGGGLLYVSTNTTSNVTVSLDGGLPGNNPSSSASPGGIGEKRLGFKAILNGFLFNSIRSSVTGDQVDSICSNMMPRKITGTIPVGGTAPFTYIWEKSYDEAFTIPSVLANDADPTNYTPTVIETATVWFRRKITDSSVPTPLVDVSKSVKIIVQPLIENNNVGNPDTICFNGDPPLMQQLLPDLIVPTTKYLFFNWQNSTDVSTWGSSIAGTKNYDPPTGLTKTSWYRRTVTSGRCVDSTAIVKITVLDTIHNNKILSPPEDICYGMTFTILSATTAATTPALGGGDASYKFKWESNINGGGWGLAPVVSNGTGYNPGELPEKIPSNEYYFRRVVYSGKHDVCVNTSAPVLLRDFPVITNNTITATQTICSGSAPAKLIGPQPLNGNGVFTYTWQDSSASHPVSDPWVDIPGEINSTVPDYQPLALTETTSYRRKAFSSACSNISNSIKIVVHKPILNNSISLLAGALTDTTICNGQIPHLFKGTNATGGISTYAYQWLDSIATTNWSLAPGAGTGVYYQPPTLTATTYYKRQVISGACTVISSATITVTVLPLITNNVISSPDLKVCFNSVPALITGTTPSGGAGEGTYLYSWEQSTDGGVNWTDAEGINNSLSGSYQPPALITETQYKRTVKSAGYDCTTNASGPVIIGIDPLPGKPYSGPDTSIYSVEKIYHMKADKELTGETGLWTILSHVTSTIDDITNNNTIIRNLSAGKNFFLWTVSKGPCDLSDSVYIELLEDFVPQGFSPNGDAWNNTFKIEGLNLEDQFVDLSVVNGAGSEVFSTSNRDGVENWKYWDGKNSKGIDLPEGTYYYLLKITSKANGQVFKKSGFIVLKRY